MKFDRTAPGGGVEVVCRLENSKAYLEWKIWIDDIGEAKQQDSVIIYLVDQKGNVVMECLKALQEEEPIEGVLLQPHLWKGTKEPYLYEMEVVLTDRNGKCADRMVRPFPLRELRDRNTEGRTGLLLNGEVFIPRAVRYSLPYEDGGVQRQRQMLEDLRQMMRLGANCVCVKKESTKSFLQFCGLCDRYGMLVFIPASNGAGGCLGVNDDRAGGCLEVNGDGGSIRLVNGAENSVLGRGGSEGEWIWNWDRGIRMGCPETVPVYRGMENALFLPDSSYPTALYYKYKAKWSEEPFIYLVPESVKKLQSGNYSVCCYSNCGRVALYTDGNLFAFQDGKEEFWFREIPARLPCIMLTAEGDGCSTSLSVHKILCKNMSISVSSIGVQDKL